MDPHASECGRRWCSSPLRSTRFPRGWSHRSRDVITSCPRSKWPGVEGWPCTTTNRWHLVSEPSVRVRFAYPSTGSEPPRPLRVRLAGVMFGFRLKYFSAHDDIREQDDPVSRKTAHGRPLRELGSSGAPISGGSMVGGARG